MFGQERGVKKKKEKKKSGEIKRNVKSETFEIKFEPVKAAYSEIGISFIFLPWSSFLFHMLFSLIFFFFLLPHQSTRRPRNQISPQFPVG